MVITNIEMRTHYILDTHTHARTQMLLFNFC